MKKIITLLFLTSILFCSKDNNEATHVLVGEWQRSDFNTDFEYKLVFTDDFTGFRTQREGNISNAISYEWSTKGELLTIDFGDENIKTTYFINPEGLLILNHYTDMTFKKLK